MSTWGGDRIMKITDVRIRKISDDAKMKAVVSVTFDDEFVVHDIKIIDGQSGLFIAMPSRKMGEGDFRDIAHPLTSETRNKIKDAIFEKYDELVEEKIDTYVIGESLAV
jgi:stage V sporulation protein G